MGGAMGDPGMQQGGPAATAIHYPPTAQALKRLVVWCIAGLVGAPALAALLLTLTWGNGTDSGGMGGFSRYIWILGVGMPIAALVWLGYASRMRAALRRSPWTECRATTVTSAMNSPTVVLQDPVSGELRVYVARTAFWLVDRADPGPAGVLWWSEGEKGGGVISRPGGGALVWLKPLRSGRKREAGLAQAAQRGLMHPPFGQQTWGQQPQQQGWTPPAPAPGASPGQPQGPYPDPAPGQPHGPHPGPAPGQQSGPQPGQQPGQYPGPAPHQQPGPYPGGGAGQGNWG